MTTATTTDPFSLDRLPEAVHGQLPPELLEGSPFAEQGAELERLRAEHAKAVGELQGIARERTTAAAADRKLLEAAMKSGKPDPGDPNTAALAEKFAAARRRVEGLADAAHTAARQLREAVEGSEGQEWADALDSDLDSAAARLEDLLAQVAETLESVDSPARAVRWLGRIRNADETDIGSMSFGAFPAVNGGESVIPVYGNPAPREVVLDAIRDSVANVRR